MNKINLPCDGSWNGIIKLTQNLTTGQEEISFSADFLQTVPIETTRAILSLFQRDRVEFHKWHKEFAASVRNASKEHPEQEDLQTAPRRPPMPPARGPIEGFVYVLRSPHGYKIGRTINLHSRMNEFLRLKLPFEIEMIHNIKTDNVREAEAQLHAKFAAKRINGEWFALTPDDVEYLKSL